MSKLSLELSPDQIGDLITDLNDLAELDTVAMTSMLTARYPCSDRLADVLNIAKTQVTTVSVFQLLNLIVRESTGQEIVYISDKGMVEEFKVKEAAVTLQDPD